MKGRIYLLICNETGLQYVGSTTHSLKKRLKSHKDDYKRFLKGLHPNVTSFDVIRGGNYDIELIEEIEFENKQDLYDIENIYIENVDCVNKYKANTGLTKKEYDKEYRKENKEKINEKFNCDCGGKYTKSHKARHEKTQKHKNFLNLKK